MSQLCRSTTVKSPRMLAAILDASMLHIRVHKQSMGACRAHLQAVDFLVCERPAPRDSRHLSSQHEQKKGTCTGQSLLGEYECNVCQLL
jgi:hypothetical protein